MLFEAHALVPDPPQIVPAARKRSWLATAADDARCLPVAIANQAGWWVLNQAEFTATPSSSGRVDVAYRERPRTVQAKHHFSGNVLTIDLPFVFRTEPGWDLHVRGPANMPLAGASPLEGIVETDWTFMPFAMNWQLHSETTFRRGFPIAQLVPIRRGQLDEFRPASGPASADVAAQYRRYFESRADTYTERGMARRTRLDGYFHGQRPDGSAFEGHRRKLRLRPFRRLG